VASWCDHPASKAICEYGVPAARVYCAYCGDGSYTLEDARLEDLQHAFGTLYNPELDEDPDNRPYIWDLPEGDCKCH